MHDASIVIGLMIILIVALALWIVLGGKKRGELIKDGGKTSLRAQVSHAEKEQMSEPQEEFVDDQPPSSGTR